MACVPDCLVPRRPTLSFELRKVLLRSAACLLMPSQPSTPNGLNEPLTGDAVDFGLVAKELRCQRNPGEAREASTEENHRSGPGGVGQSWHWRNLCAKRRRSSFPASASRTEDLRRAIAYYDALLIARARHSIARRPALCCFSLTRALPGRAQRTHRARRGPSLDVSCRFGAVRRTSRSPDSERILRTVAASLALV
jgi:hypothetical protein